MAGAKEAQSHDSLFYYDEFPQKRQHSASSDSNRHEKSSHVDIDYSFTFSSSGSSRYLKGGRGGGGSIGRTSSKSIRYDSNGEREDENGDDFDEDDYEGEPEYIADKGALEQTWIVGGAVFGAILILIIAYCICRRFMKKVEKENNEADLQKMDRLKELKQLEEEAVAQSVQDSDLNAVESISHQVPSNSASQKASPASAHLGVQNL